MKINFEALRLAGFDVSVEKDAYGDDIALHVNVLDGNERVHCGVYELLGELTEQPQGVKMMLADEVVNSLVKYEIMLHLK